MSEDRKHLYKDEELIEKMKQNIETGTAFVMEQYAGLIWTVCSKYLQNSEDIKECVNEVFADFSLNYEKFKKEKGSLRNYLCTIAKNCAVNKYNNNLRQQQVEQAVTEHLSTEKREGYKNRDKELLDEALDHLAPVDSQILRMKYYDGMTFKEIAEQLQMDYNLVKKRSQRSYKKLLKIILLGLLLALLAACAAIIFRQYRVSEQSGFLWSVETAVYGNDEDTDVVVMGDVAYQITDAAYYDSQMKIEVSAKWLGVKEGDWKEKLRLNVDEHIYADEKRLWTYGIPLPYQYKNGTVFCDGDNRIELIPKVYDLRYDTIDDVTGIIKLYMEYEGFLEENEEKEIPLKIALVQDHMVEITLKQLPMIEYKYKEETIRLGDDSIIAIGPNYTGDSNTIISLYHMDGTEYEVSAWITNHYGGVGTWTDKVKPIVLLDKEGHETTVQRVMGESSNDVGIGKDFQLYFPKLAPGEYALEIPYLCLLKEGSTEELVLEVPMEDGVVKECDYHIYFEDGAGYHITGIRRQKEVQITEAMLFDGTWVEQEIINWNYYLIYETISAGEMIFCHSDVEGTTKSGTRVSGNMDIENQFYLKVQQEEAPRQLTVTFKKPVYILDEPISVALTIQNGE